MPIVTLFPYYAAQFEPGLFIPDWFSYRSVDTVMDYPHHIYDPEKAEFAAVDQASGSLNIAIVLAEGQEFVAGDAASYALDLYTVSPEPFLGAEEDLSYASLDFSSYEVAEATVKSAAYAGIVAALISEASLASNGIVVPQQTTYSIVAAMTATATHTLAVDVSVVFPQALPVNTGTQYTLAGDDTLTIAVIAQRSRSLPEQFIA